MKFRHALQKIAVNFISYVFPKPTIIIPEVTDEVREKIEKILSNPHVTYYETFSNS